MVAYHGATQLRLALAPLSGLDVLVVDNSSSAEVEAVADQAGAAYLDSKANLGFARAVNLGIERAAGRDVVLVNPDAVVEAETVLALVKLLHTPGARIAATAPALSGPDGHQQRVRWPFPSPAGAWLQAAGLGRVIRAEPSFLVGAVLALNADAVAEIGGFDPRYFLYAEETDWQRRAAAAGWHLELARGLNASHVGGGTRSDESRREVHFHAGGERYVRTWWGARGWASYRLAVLLGRTVRGAVLPGERGRAARRRARLYRRGPLRSERALDARGTVVHVVLTDNFAGTEQVVCTEAVGLAQRGWDVTVVGGDPARMVAALGPAVHHRPAATLLAGLYQLARVGRADVVHAHLTAAELAAVLTRPLSRAPVVATRHIAAHRGASRLGGLLAPLVLHGLARQIAISPFVAAAVGEQTTVVLNGVSLVDPIDPSLREPIVLVLQRLEPEKSTDVALRAWAYSGLGEQGWRLQVAGTGRQRADLERLARALGVAATVEFLGWVDDPAGFLATAGLLLAPTSVEGFGLSVAEAMAHGLCVVAADGGAHRDVLGPAGVLVPPGDATEAGQQLRALADDPQGRARRGAALRARQQELLSMSAHLHGVERVYAELTP